MATPTPDDVLNNLFPLPTQNRLGLSPTPTPGVTYQAGNALVRSLKDDYERHHIFFNHRGFHNHATHHLLAIYALGASPALLDAAYETHVVYQRAAFDSPGEITEKNWKDHFGDEKYYRAYLKFFTTVVLDKGIAPTLEAYFFSSDANWDGAKPAQMLNRLLSGVIHPYLHVGYAIEFESPGMMAEGLAMACVTPTDTDALVPQELFTTPRAGTLSALTSALSLSAPAKPKGTHSFTLLARMLEDPAFAPGVACKAPSGPSAEPFKETLANCSKRILEYVAEWTVDTTDAADVKAKVEELAWLATLVYGVGGQQPGKLFSADFFSMHLVTSSLFVDSFVKALTPTSLSLLLRTYLSVVFALWISRGRPGLSLKNFYATTSAIPTPRGPTPTANASTLDREQPTTNPWFPILQTTLSHINEHLPKIQRTLAHYSAVYGAAPPGIFKDTGLEGAELIDGTLFVRVAGLTADALGWTREGEEKQEWAFLGFF